MSTPIVRRRKRPVEVDTIQWTGTNEADVRAFAGAIHFHTVGPDDRYRVPDADITAEVWDRLHSTWVGVKTGQHVVRGVKGELYPIDEDVLAETYELVEEEATAAAATATPDFFQAGHTYTEDAPFRAPEDRPNFQCIAVAIHPTTGGRRAFGFDQPGAGGPWSSASMRDEEWADGWVDVTEAGGGRG